MFVPGRPFETELIGPRPNVIKLFTAVIYKFLNKIELLFLAGHSSLN